MDQLSRESNALVHFSNQARAGCARPSSQPLVKFVRNTGVVGKDIGRTVQLGLESDQ